MTNHITKTTRAPRTGRLIVCPHCSSTHRLFHFAWCALVCPDCGEAVDKYDWIQAAL
jgi:uncharacterized protein (DUF983 family)